MTIITLESSVSGSDFVTKHMKSYIQMVSNGCKTPPVETLVSMILELQQFKGRGTRATPIR